MSESITLRSAQRDERCLQLTFEKAADRWSHRLEWISDGDCVELMTSVEGSAELDWPPSPPLQEISQQDLGSQLALLGVGMAGRSHWSISCISESGDEYDTMVLDLACLCKGETPGWLGSTYKLHPEIVREVEAPAETKRNAFSFATRYQKFELDTQSGEGWSTAVLVENDQLKITPAEISASSKVATRWAFELKVRRNRR